MTRRFSNSEIQTFKRCRRKWFLAYYRRLKPIDRNPASALMTGSRVHTALEAYYQPGDRDLVTMRAALSQAQREDWRAYYEAAKATGGVSPDVKSDFKSACDLENAMIEGYVEWLGETGADADLEVVDVEREIEVHAHQLGIPVGDFSLIGKLDIQAHNHLDGTTRFVDHKTAKTFPQLITALPMNEQALHYNLLLFLSELNEHDEVQPIDGAIFNMLRKVKRTARANPPFYQREIVNHSPDQIESYKWRVLGVVRTILEVEAELRSADVSENGQLRLMAVYPTPNLNCSWDCEFSTLCPLMDDDSRAEDMIQNEFEAHDPLERYRKEKHT